MDKRRRGPVITIDGPAGAGKSTLAKGLAVRLGLKYIDTGAMYRAITLKAIKANVDPESESGLASLCQASYIKIAGSKGNETRIILDGEDVTQEIRSPAVSSFVSQVSRHQKVRSYLTRLQREMADAGKVVLEGRDTGTCVYPEADVKIYLVASFDARVRRRHLELLAKGYDIKEEEVAQDIARRDRIDSTREVSPLLVPDGAFILDSTNLGIEETIQRALWVVREVLPVDL
ncbi:MAG TPA: (d)CMP kinase [Clostridia bacterium]|nr:(d)CMP kinase [Clostridia bacterium]